MTGVSHDVLIGVQLLALGVTLAGSVFGVSPVVAAGVAAFFVALTAALLSATVDLATAADAWLRDRQRPVVGSAAR